MWRTNINLTEVVSVLEDELIGGADCRYVRRCTELEWKVWNATARGRSPEDGGGAV
jgi:hypothetical protein